MFPQLIVCLLKCQKVLCELGKFPTTELLSTAHWLLNYIANYIHNSRGKMEIKSLAANNYLRILCSINIPGQDSYSGLEFCIGYTEQFGYILIYATDIKVQSQFSFKVKRFRKASCFSYKSGNSQSYLCAPKGKSNDSSCLCLYAQLNCYSRHLMHECLLG